MKLSRDYLNKAMEEGWALPHFNFDNSAVLRAIAEVAARLKSPVFVGTSEGERNFLGLEIAVKSVEALSIEFEIPIFLNADHTKSLEMAKAAVDAGYHAVLIDGTDKKGTTKSFEENMKIASAVVEYARSKNKNIVVEGEMGYMFEGSKIRDEIVEVKPENMTDPDEAREFVKKTGVDIFAPAVGNIHGIAMNEPKLDIERISKVSAATKVPLVLHGGSGLSDEQIKKAITNGISMVHVSTEIRAAFTQSLRKLLSENEKEIAPYRYIKEALNPVREILERKINLFGSAGKI